MQLGLLGGILTYAADAGIIENNPAHGIRKPKDNVRKRRLSEASIEPSARSRASRLKTMAFDRCRVLAAVVELAVAQEELEGWIMSEVQDGAGLPGLYPPNAENLARYQARRRPAE